MNKKWIAAVGGTTLGLASFVGVRMYIRNAVKKALVEDYDFDHLLTKNPLYALIAQQINVPTSNEIATSLVPLWSLTDPYTAIEDVLKNRRKSAFWPANRRTSSAPDWVDTAIFNVLLAMYEKNKEPRPKIGQR